MSACQNGAPVFVSLPHFLYGKHYEGLVNGLQPTPALHDTYIDVEKVCHSDITILHLFIKLSKIN